MSRGLVAGLLCCLMVGSAPSHGLAARLPVPYPSPLTLSLLRIINSERSAHGVGKLPLSRASSRCAWLRSKRMSYEGRISDTKRIANEVCQPYKWAGENVGSISTGPPYGDSPLHTPEWGIEYLQHLMMSEGPCPRKWCSMKEWEMHGHYLNIVDPEWESVGLGIYHRQGRLYITEVFSTLHQWPVGP